MAEARSSTFRVLRHRDFRLLWGGLVVSAVGTWMQIVAQALLVLDLSHGSALALGCVSLAQAAAFLVFALFGGAVADRVDKRRLLIATQSLCLMFAVVLGVLTLRHWVAVWMVVLLAFLQGAALSFDQPARSALVPELVPKEELFNAVSLQSIVFTGASTLGPALAGFGLATFGYAGNFFANAVSYLGVIAALLSMRMARAEIPAPLRTANPKAIGEALATVRADAALPALIGVFAALLFFGPSPTVLIPLMSQQILHLGAVQIGLLFSASGVGAVAGGLALASLHDPAHKARIVLSAAGLWAIALLGFALSRSFAWAVLALGFVGLFQVGVSATTITLMQTRVPPQMRGRVMSLNTLLIMGVRPLGDFPAAAVIAGIGAPLTASVCAALVALVTAGVASRPGVRNA
jgi:MFS family permease